MMRVYLDWNVFSYLRSFSNSREPYTSLNRNLLMNQDRLLIPYTSAHLTDLITSYKKSETGKLKTLEDLKYLEQLTKGRGIFHDYSNNNTYCDIYDIKEYFEQLLESDNLTSGTLDNLFEPVSEIFGDSFLSLLKTIPVGTEALFHSQENQSSSVSYFNKMFQGTSAYDILSNTFSVMTDFTNDPKLYRGIRNDSLTQLNLTHDYTQTPDPIEEIDKNLKTSNFKKTFKEFADMTLKSYFKDKEPSRYDIFTNYYMTLDFLGYYRDKVFKNMLQDAIHAYYGAHCDFFVTDDDNTYHKAKVIYEVFNIQTIVCKSDEFNYKYYGKVTLNPYGGKKWFENISDIISKSFVIANQHDENFNPVDIYRMDFYLLNYFNRLQITHNIEGTKNIFLFKNNKTYSSFYFFDELKQIINQICLEIGQDDFGRIEYSELDKSEMLKNEWSGRNWTFENFQIKLFIEKAPFGLSLAIVNLKA